MSINFPNKLEFDCCDYLSSINGTTKICRFGYNFTLKGYLDFTAIIGNQDEEKLVEVWNYFTKNTDKLKDILKVLFGAKRRFEGEIDVSFINSITYGRFAVISFSTISELPFNYDPTVLSCICYYNDSIDRSKFKKYNYDYEVKGGEPNAPLPSRTEKKTIKLIPKQQRIIEEPSY